MDVSVDGGDKHIECAGNFPIESHVKHNHDKLPTLHGTKAVSQSRCLFKYTSSIGI